MCSHTCGFPIVPETDDDDASSRPALLRGFVSLFDVMSAMGHVFRDAAWRIACLSVCLVCRGVSGRHAVTGISILVLALLDFSFFSFVLQRDLSSLELTISLFFYFAPFLFLYSPLIEPGALNSQKSILSIILAHITTALY